MNVLAVIPVRAGSKGLPGKNLAPLAGRPLLAWTIDAARASQSVARVVVSTDSQEIAAVARGCGAEAPFMRPAALATDDAASIDVVLHAACWLEKSEGYRPDAIMELHATSPLRTATDIDEAAALCAHPPVDAVVSVTPVGSHHPCWMQYLDSSGCLRPFVAQGPMAQRRQDLPALYTLNGAIYVARRAWLLEHRTWFAPRTRGYVMPPERSVDIDSPWDLHIADLVLRNRAAGT